MYAPTDAHIQFLELLVSSFLYLFERNGNLYQTWLFESYPEAVVGGVFSYFDFEIRFKHYFLSLQSCIIFFPFHFFLSWTRANSSYMNKQNKCEPKIEITAWQKNLHGATFSHDASIVHTHTHTHIYFHTPQTLAVFFNFYLFIYFSIILVELKIHSKREKVRWRLWMELMLLCTLHST